MAAAAAPPKLKLTKVELLPIRATQRTVWMIVRLHTDAGLTGLGEASDAFGFSATSKADAQKMEAELRHVVELIRGRSPLDVEWLRQKGEPRARAGGLMAATAYSAIEQAMWDLAGQALGVPTHTLFGGAVRNSMPVYANINRAASPRNPAGFADSARRAVADGFRSVKAAPFDGFPQPGSPARDIAGAVELGIACTEAIRKAVGPDVAVMIDCHSFFTVAMAVDVARRLEPVNLAWYEEPVAPQKLEETIAIRKAIRQPMAGGEILFGVDGFVPLCRNRAVEVIMPDVKHCGGLVSMSHIAAMAEAEGVAVAPHNPSGPVATAASVHACAGMKNFRILEMQYGETDWRGDLVEPPERFRAGSINVPEGPGFGIRLNDRLARSKMV